MEENNKEKTVLEKIVAEYVSMIKDINDAYQKGIEQPKISTLIGPLHRMEGESYNEYKMRKTAENMITKHYLRGVRFNNEI